MCSPTSVLAVSFSFPSYSLRSQLSDKDGAACAIIASEDFVHTHNLENQAIEIIAQALTTDGPETYDSRSPMEMVGYGMTRVCAENVFQAAGFARGEGRDQVGVAELHDCFAANEVRASLTDISLH
jgi:sterol carrier protein 2